MTRPGDGLKPVDAHLDDILAVVGPLSALDLTLPEGAALTRVRRE